MRTQAQRMVKKVVGHGKASQQKTEELTPFGQRIQARTRRFYQGKHNGIHSGEVCRGTFLTRDVPMSRWHCCPLWQRKLDNKWNSREFAVKFGYRVPELYWHGRQVEDIDFGSLPEHYVIRPTMGWSSRGVFVMAEGVNLMDQKRYSEAEIKASLAHGLKKDPRAFVLVEEFVRSEDGEYRLPHEYKLYVFGDKVAAILAIRRKKRKDSKDRWYTAAWEPFDAPFNTRFAMDEVTAPPKCLDDMLAAAKTLGKAYGAFVRIDFYATDKGLVFGEFTPSPTLGRGYTDYASQHLLKYWNETYPDPTYI